MIRSSQIRDAIADRIAAAEWFPTVLRTYKPTRQPDGMPACQVFVMSETMSPDGDGNVANPRFVADAVIAVSVIRGFEEPDTLAGKLNDDLDAIEALLLTDATFFTFTPGLALFESIPTMARRWVFADDGETYFAEMRIEITFRYRVDFAPVVTTPFEGLNVRTWPHDKIPQPPADWRTATGPTPPVVGVVNPEQ